MKMKLIYKVVALVTTLTIFISTFSVRIYAIDINIVVPNDDDVIWHIKLDNFEVENYSDMYSIAVRNANGDYCYSSSYYEDDTHPFGYYKILESPYVFVDKEDLLSASLEFVIGLKDVLSDDDEFVVELYDFYDGYVGCTNPIKYKDIKNNNIETYYSFLHFYKFPDDYKYTITNFAPKITLQVDENGGAEISDVSIYKGTFYFKLSEYADDSYFSSTYPFPEVSRTGYTLIDWLVNGENIGDDGGVFNEDSNIKAIWKANDYEVKFNGNGAESGSMENQAFTYDIASKLNSNSFTKTDNTFNGWNTKIDKSGTHYEDEEEVINLKTSGTIELFAEWIEDRTLISDNNVELSSNNLNNLIVKTNGKLENLNCVELDGVVIEPFNYIANEEDGNLLITINKSFLESLSKTSHIITIKEDGAEDINLVINIINDGNIINDRYIVPNTGIK